MSFFASDDYFSPQIGPESSVAVLHVRAIMPRVSFMKAMGMSLLSAGLSAGATGGSYVAVATPTGVAHSTALLFDNQTGEVIWKNQGTGDLSRFGPQAQARFFKNFPTLDAESTANHASVETDLSRLRECVCKICHQQKGHSLMTYL